MPACQGFTWDALGRRVEFFNDVPSTATTRYWYDGVNEVHSLRLTGTAPSQAEKPLFFVHGVSYIDEHLALIPTATNEVSLCRLAERFALNPEFPLDNPQTRDIFELALAENLCLTS